jgi:hypothetical protein
MLREEHRLRVFEYRLLRKMFALVGRKSRGWGRLFDKVLLNM